MLDCKGFVIGKMTPRCSGMCNSCGFCAKLKTLCDTHGVVLSIDMEFEQYTLRSDPTGHRLLPVVREAVNES